MGQQRDVSPASVVDAFVDVVGTRLWSRRIAQISRGLEGGSRAARALTQHHAMEISLERLRRHGLNRPLTVGEMALLRLAGETARVLGRLPRAGRERMRLMLRAGLAEGGTLVPIFHLIRTAMLQRARGFDIHFAAFEDAAPFDLMLARDGIEAELSCDVVSAEAGRDVPRGAWVNLVDRIDPDLQTWLANHPGRYLLKMTLPQGLRTDADGQPSLAALHERIRTMLHGQRRADHDEAAVLRLDPLMLAAAQADSLGIMSSLRREFGDEAHLAVTSAGSGVFVLAARAGRENEVAGAVRRRMSAIAPARLTGSRPGILAMFVEDTDRAEWRHLRDRLELEGEARQFLTCPEARVVVAVTCASRMELLGGAPPHAASDGELRFRNPSHPAAKAAALAPAVLSSV